MSPDEYDELLARHADEVHRGRNVGAITGEMLGANSDGEAWDLLVMLARAELLRRAGERNRD